MRQRSRIGYFVALGALLLLGRMTSPKKDGNRPSDRPRHGAARSPIKVEILNEGWHDDEKRHRRLEQIYWRRSVLFAVVAAIIALSGAMAAFGAFQQALRQADAADDGNRPWISVEDFKIVSVSTDTTTVHGAFDIVVKNIGHSPAQNIYVSAKLRVRFLEDGDLISDLKDYCSQSEMPKYQYVGVVAFPDKPVAAPGATYRPLADMRAVFEEKGAGMPFEQFSKRAPLEMIGCVLYGDSRQRLHHTSFLYELGAVNITTEHRVEKDSLSPVANGLSGSFAD